MASRPIKPKDPSRLPNMNRVAKRPIKPYINRTVNAFNIIKPVLIHSYQIPTKDLTKSSVTINAFPLLVSSIIFTIFWGELMLTLLVIVFLLVSQVLIGG